MYKNAHKIVSNFVTLIFKLAYNITFQFEFQVIKNHNGSFEMQVFNAKWKNQAEEWKQNKVKPKDEIKNTIH